MVRADLGTPANDVAATRLTVPAKMMLDCLSWAAWLSVACGNAAGESRLVHRMPARKNLEVFIQPSFSLVMVRTRFTASPER